MATFIRYALATVCLAASVGCLALWWRSYSTWEMITFLSFNVSERLLHLQSSSGTAIIGLMPLELSQVVGPESQLLRHTFISDHLRDGFLQSIIDTNGPFGQCDTGYYFPHWYPALVFALAAIAALRVGRRFTIRSAIIGTTIVAGLLGMAVIL